MPQYIVVTPSFGQPYASAFGDDPIKVDETIVNAKAEAERLVAEAKARHYMSRPEANVASCYFYEVK